MEMGPIIRRAWDLSLKYKSLWVFGLFAESFGTIQSIWREGTGTDASVGSHISGTVLVALLVAASFVGLAFLVMSIISSVGLIDAANKIARGGKYTFGSSFSAGLDFFWRYLGLLLLFMGGVIALVLVVGLPTLVFFLIHTAVGILSLFFLIPAAVVGMFILGTIYMLAQRAMIVRNISIGDAVEEGYWLLKLHLNECIKIFLVFILLLVAIGLITVSIIGFIAVPFILMALTSGTGLFMALALGAPLVLLVMLVLDGLFGTFFSSMYTLFYFELLEPAPAVTPGIAGQPAL